MEPDEEQLYSALALGLVRMLRAVAPHVIEVGEKDEWVIDHSFQTGFVDPCHVLWRLGVTVLTNAGPGTPRYRFDEVDFNARWPEPYIGYYVLPRDEDVGKCIDKIPMEHRPKLDKLVESYMKFNDDYGAATTFQLPTPFGKLFSVTHPYQIPVLEAFVSNGYAETLDDGQFIWKDSMLRWLQD